MHITFFGAVREVTGSMHLISVNGDRILLDCGMFQGRRREAEIKNRVLPFDPEIITNILLSHAHIDHSGRIPLLVKNKFNGHIICTRPTVDVCQYLLVDSAHIQESDARYLNYKSVRAFLYNMRTSPKTKRIPQRDKKWIKKMLKKPAFGGVEINEEAIVRLQDKYKLGRVIPLYSIRDAQKAMDYFEGYPLQYPITVGKDVTCKLYVAGHIIGSVISIVHAKENGIRKTICYSGDIGRFNKPIIKDPTLVYDEADRDIDLLIMESTYGNREHEPIEMSKETLKRIINETYNRGGSIVIPAFAFGRTQEMIYLIHQLCDEGAVPRIAVYVDSPLAVNLTRVFGEHPETYRDETQKLFIERGDNPFSFRNIRFVHTVEDSMALMRDDTPHIVISASGMCETGRILHHLRYKIHNPRNTILLVGFMAEYTLGRKIQDLGEEINRSGYSGAPPEVKILDKWYPVRAHIEKIEGLSAHGDKTELMRVITQSNLRIKRIAVVHGEESQSVSFANELARRGYSVTVPRYGESVTI